MNRSFFPGDQVVSNLREGLDGVAGLCFLLRDLGRESLDVVISVLMVIEAELPNRSVVDDSSITKNVVAVPIHPAKYIITFEPCGRPRKILCYLLAHVFVTPASVLGGGPVSVGGSSLDPVIHGRPESLEVALFEVPEEMRRAKQALGRAHIDGAAVREFDDGQGPLGGYTIFVEYFAEQSCADPVVDVVEAVAIADSRVAGFEEAFFESDSWAESGGAGARTRNVPGHAVASEFSIPNSSSIARRQSSAVRMLKLEVSSRHVGVRLHVLGIEAGAFLDVVVVDDHQGEMIQNLFNELGVEPVRMVFGDQPHFFGEWEIKEGNLAVVARASLIKDIAVRNRLLERVKPIDLAKTGIRRALTQSMNSHTGPIGYLEPGVK